MTMGRQIRRARQQTGRSVQALAYEARIHPATWYSAEAGADLTVSRLCRIAEAVGLELVLRPQG